MNITRTRFKCSAQLLLLWLFSWDSVVAADRWLAAVSTVGSTHPPFTVDGVCNPTEYSDAWSLARIMYPTTFGAAGVRIIATPTDLFVCVNNLLQSPAFESSTVSLRFADSVDATDSGNGELSFQVTQAGSSFAIRWAPSGLISGSLWNAAAVKDGSGRWVAEFRVSRSLIPHATAGSRTSIIIENTRVAGVTGNYHWPPRDPSAGSPPQWGQILWLPAAGTGASVAIDQLRITHGLEVDRTAGVAYDLVAGKDLLVRAQCYTTLADPAFLNAEVHVRRVSPDLGPVIAVPIAPGGTNLLNRFPYGYFNGSRTLDTWIDGSNLQTPGGYQLTLRITMASLPSPVVMDLGTYAFRETKDLRLLLVPWNDGAPGYTRPWGNDLTALVPLAMDEMARMYPVRTGTDIARLFPETANGGLRYLLYFGGGCRPGESLIDCDVRKRTFANDVLLRLNAMVRGATDPSHRDRFDFHVVMAGVTNDGGGQMQPWYSPRSSAIYFNPNLRGNNGSLISQEVGHALDLVSTDSPNSIDGLPGSHSMNNEIPLATGRGMINFRERIEYSPTLSTMAPGVGTAQQSFFEGFEWNRLRVSLLNKPDDPGIATASIRRHGPTASPLFHLVGWIDQQDAVTLHYSETLDVLDYAETPPAPNSPYVLRFLGANNTVLAQLPFAVGFEREHHENEPPTTLFSGINLADPMPQGTTGIEIRKTNSLLFAQTVTPSSPVIGGLTIQDLGGEKLRAQWQASDVDSQVLRYNVFFFRPEDGLRRLVDAGVKDTFYDFDTSLAPATKAGQLIVQVTDGFNSAESASQSFAIEATPPTVLLDWLPPASPGRLLVEAQTLHVFRGYAYDRTDGPVLGKQMSWTSDISGFLGTGNNPAFALPAGKHHITLTAQASSGLSSSTSVDVEIFADTDGDGLPDLTELTNQCEDKNVFDSQSDPDGDGLTNLEEWRLGLNPCDPDTDGDGITDGDEVMLGSRPADAQSKPVPPSFHLSSPQVDLLGCGNQGNLAVWTSKPDLRWQALPGADWLTVTPSSGTGSTLLALKGSCTGLSAGVHETDVMILGPGQPPLSLHVRFFVPAGNAPSLPYGFQNTPLGSATLASPVSGQIAVQNIGTTGNDGVSLRFGSAEAFEIRFDSAISAQNTPADASFRITAVDIFGHSLGDIHGRDIGAGYSTEVRFDPLGSPTYRVKLYDHDTLLYEQSGRDSNLSQNGGNVIPYSQPQRVRLERTPVGELKIVFTWDSQVDVEIPNRIGAGPTTFMVDRMELMPISQTPLVAEVSGLELRFSHLSQRVIVDQAVSAFGINHRGLGDAILVVDGPALFVGNLGANNAGGVAIDLGKVSAGSAEILPFLSPTFVAPGAFEKVTAVGPMYNPLAALKVTRTLTGYEVRREISGFSPVKETLQLLLSGQVVAEINATGQDLAVAGIVSPFDFKAQITGSGKLLLSTRWAEPTTLQGKLLPGVDADTVQWLFEASDEFLPGSLEALWVEAMGVPGFKVYDSNADAANPNTPIEIIGVLHRALGNSVPRLDANGNLVIKNLTSSGADGICVSALGRTLLGLHFSAAIPASQTASGTRSDIAVLDPSGAALALISGQDVGEAYEMKVDCGAIQSATHRLRVWKSNAQILDLPGRTLPLYPGSQAKDVITGRTAGNDISITLLWDGIIAINVPEAQGGVIFGDKLEILSEKNQPNASLELGSVEMRWSNIGTRTLFSTTPRPASLGFDRSPSTLNLKWTEGSGVKGVFLEEADDLSPNAQWTPVASQPTENNGKVSIAIPPGAANKFYRLHELP